MGTHISAMKSEYSIVVIMPSFQVGYDVSITSTRSFLSFSITVVQVVLVHLVGVRIPEGQQNK